jgi:two-component system chemotaxis sensor kinase CheA
VVAEQRPAPLPKAAAIDDIRDPAEPRPAVGESPDASAADGAEAPYRIETIRVTTKRLDELLRQCGELIVTQQRMRTLEAGLGPIVSALQQMHYASRRGDDPSHRHAPQRTRASALEQQVLGLRERARSDIHRLEALTRSLAENVRNARMLPLSTLFSLFPRMVRDIAHNEGKQVELLIDGEDTTADKNVVEQLKDPLMHILRNAVHHGIEPPNERVRAGKPEQGRISLSAVRAGASVRITVADDGRGVDLERAAQAIVRSDANHRSPNRHLVDLDTEAEKQDRAAILEALFRPGVTTEAMITDISGRGVGLDVVRRSVEDLKGSVQVNSETGASFSIQLELPITLATTRVLMLRSGELQLALPLDAVQRLFRLAPQQLYRREGEPAIDDQGQALSLLDLGEVFGQTVGPIERRQTGAEHCVIIGRHEQRVAILVDAIDGAQDVLMRPLGGVLRRLRGVAGSAILSNGHVCAVLNASDLLEMPFVAAGPATDSSTRDAGALDNEPGRTLLLVEDSMLTRLQEKRLLESAGYRVISAADGAAAWELLNPAAGSAKGPFGRRGLPDALVTDINMPRMDGLQLTERVRADSRLRGLPVVLVTTLASEEDQRRGLTAGADAYITKGTFNNQLLLSTLERLL